MRVPDLIAPGLKVLFCGINPGLYSAAVGHNFARPGNRFWPTLYAAGFTPRRLRPEEEGELLKWGYGITNFVERATAGAAELKPAEIIAGGKRVEKKVLKYEPAFVAFVGITSYRTAFRRPKAQMGLQPETIGKTKLWVLPNPSGLNAGYPARELIRLFKELRVSSGNAETPARLPHGLRSLH